MDAFAGTAFDGDAGLMLVPFQKNIDGKTECGICPLHCRLSEGQSGVCKGRKVVEGELIATNYGRSTSFQVDPIEKKPLYHFKPGSMIASAGANGCNLSCNWCQNCTISQFVQPTRYMAPKDMGDWATSHDLVGLAYTYTEPFIWYETVRDAGAQVRKRGGVNVLVTNGMVAEEPLEALLPLIDAANVDLKFIDPEPYQEIGGDLEAVQRTIRMLARAGAHLEITHLLVTGKVDEDSVGRLAEWIANVDRGIPLHLTRYFPRHRWDQPATSRRFMERVYRIASESLDHVYLGNAVTEVGRHTYCAVCGSIVVRRRGEVDTLGMEADGSCSHCGSGVIRM